MKTLILIISLFFVTSSVGFCGIIQVTSTADSGAGTLREALANAQPGDEIQLSFNAPDSIVLNSSLVVNTDVLIQGPGRNLASIKAAPNSTMSQVLTINAGVNVMISGLTISGATMGDGIRNLGATLTLMDCRISNNRLGLRNGGGFTIQGFTSEMILQRCEVINNSGPVGGGILNEGANGDSSILRVNHSLIANNSNTNARFSDGAGIRNITLDNFGASPSYAFCYLESSTITGNAVIAENAASGGGVSSVTGPMNGGEAFLHMNNCTVSGNRCEATNANGRATGGGIYVLINDFSPELNTAEITHCTITENHVAGGTMEAMGAYLGSSTLVTGPLLEMRYNIIAGNTQAAGNSVALDVSNQFVASANDFNILGIGANIPGPLLPYVGTTGQPLDVKICSLGMNGGETPTHALLPGSIAVDFASSSTRTVDQRDSLTMGLPDAGAVEFRGNVFGTYSISGTLTQSTGSPLQNTTVFLIEFNAQDSSLTQVATATTDNAGNYSMNASGPKEYFLKAAPDSSAYPNEIPTYYESALIFDEAAGIGVCGDSQVDIQTIAGANPGGPGFIGGNISDGANKKTLAGLADVPVLLVDSLSGLVAAFTVTSAEGNFTFSKLALSTYEVWVDVPFVDNSLAPTFTLDSQTPELENLGFELKPTFLEWIGFVNGIDPAELWDQNSFSIYPNPASEMLNISLKDHKFEKDISLKVYDTTGRLQMENTFSPSLEHTIDLEGLSPGLYLYQFLSEGKIRATGRLVMDGGR